MKEESSGNSPSQRAKRRYTIVSPKEFPFGQNRLLNLRHQCFQISQANQEIFRRRKSHARMENLKLFNFENMLGTVAPKLDNLKEDDDF